jgi:hypothetical protein
MVVEKLKQYSQNFAIGKEENSGLVSQRKLLKNKMILSQTLFIVSNLSSLSIAEVQNIYSLNPAMIGCVCESLSLTGYGVTFPFLFTQYKY